jgi:hypothetical protein
MSVDNSIYNGLWYSTKQINSSFKIWVYGRLENGYKLDTLVGVSGLINLIGIDLTNKFVDRAFNDTVDADKCICKLRRGIKITFYNY